MGLPFGGGNQVSSHPGNRGLAIFELLYGDAGQLDAGAITRKLRAQRSSREDRGRPRRDTVARWRLLSKRKLAPVVIVPLIPIVVVVTVSVHAAICHAHDQWRLDTEVQH